MPLGVFFRSVFSFFLGLLVVGGAWLTRELGFCAGSSISCPAIVVLQLRGVYLNSICISPPRGYICACVLYLSGVLV